MGVDVVRLDVVWLDVGGVSVDVGGLNVDVDVDVLSVDVDGMSVNVGGLGGVYVSDSVCVGGGG